jgi:hypothetical protein
VRVWWRAQAGPALAIWWSSRLGLFLLITLLPYALAIPSAGRIHDPGGWVLERFVWWDSFHYLRIADRGYLPPGLPCCDQVFFPGYPLITRALAPLTGGSTVYAGLLITQLAASAAAVLLWRLAVADAGPRAGRIAVVLLAVTPYGIFLSSVYSEALFLALSLAAWLAAARRRWWWAGLLAAGVAAVRVNGVFLSAALAVVLLGQLRADRRRPGPEALALGLPLVAVAGWLTYLHARTGSWTAWPDAQVIAWHRQTAWPWEGLRAGWQALTHAPSQDLVVTRAADLLVAVAGLALTGALLVGRRWAEAVLVGLNVAVVVCSNNLASTPRYALTWFPVYLLLARWVATGSGRRAYPALVAVSAALMAALSLLFTVHLWLA